MIKEAIEVHQNHRHNKEKIFCYCFCCLVAEYSRSVAFTRHVSTRIEAKFYRKTPKQHKFGWAADIY